MSPNQPKTPARAFRPPPELWERVVAEAESAGVTYTDVMILALEAYFAAGLEVERVARDINERGEL